MMIDKKVLYVSEVASLLGCCSAVVYKLIENGNLKAYKDAGGKRWQIPELALNDYIQQSQEAFETTKNREPRKRSKV